MSDALWNLTKSLSFGVLLYAYLYLEETIHIPNFIIGVMHWFIIPVAIAALCAIGMRGRWAGRLIWGILSILIAGCLFGVTISNLSSSESLTYLMVYVVTEVVLMIVVFAVIEGILQARRMNC